MKIPFADFSRLIANLVRARTFVRRSCNAFPRRSARNFVIAGFGLAEISIVIYSSPQRCRFAVSSVIH